MSGYDVKFLNMMLDFYKNWQNFCRQFEENVESEFYTSIDNYKYLHNKIIYYKYIHE